MSSHFDDILHHSYITGPDTDEMVNHSIPEGVPSFMVTDATPEHRSPASQLFSERLVYACRVDVKPDAWRNVKQMEEAPRVSPFYLLWSIVLHLFQLHTQLLNTSGRVRVTIGH